MKFTSRWSIISIYAGLIVVFAAMLLFSSTITSRKALLGHARNIMANIASYTTDKSSNYLLPARDAARLTRGLAKSNILSQNNSAAMEAYFYEQLFIYPQFSGIYFGTVDGEFIMASRYNKFEYGGYFTKTINKTEGERRVSLVYRDPNFKATERRFDSTDDYDPRERPWFQMAKEKEGLIWTSPYVFFTSKKPGITTANPVYGPDGELRGVIGVDIALDELSIFLSRLKVSENGLAFIMNVSGDVVAYPDLAKVKTPVGDKLRLTTIEELDDAVARKAYETIAPPKGQPFLLNESVFTSFEHRGETWHAMFAPFGEVDWPWVIGIYLPENDYLGTIKKNGIFNIGISVIAVILGGIIGLLVARRLMLHRREAEAAANAKSHFLARMSHEIRTPMNALLGASELLSETELTVKQKQYLNLFQNAGGVLHDLVSDVLDFSAIEAGKITIAHKPFPLRQTLEETCSVLSLGAHEKGLEFACNIAPATPNLLIGDSARIKQVLVNLIANAVKFTDTGTIEVRCVPVGTMDSDNATLAFSVRDTGIGIPEEMQTRVFKSFTQVDQTSAQGLAGTGLGLAISRHLVELMGGRIDLSSEPGKGSIFRCLLPLKICGRAEAGMPDATRVTTSSKGLHVLLVDDDESNRLILDMFLRGAGHLSTTVSSGKTALETLKSQSFDLVLMDIEMPGMTGHETAQRIRRMEEELARTPVPLIAISGHTELGESNNAAEFDELLTKPIKKGDLLALLERYAKK